MQTAALIVAAGMSSRMGDFKPMLSIGSISIAQRVVATFRQAGIRKIVMVTGFNAVTLERHLSGSGVIFLRNDAYETTQMFDSVKIGLDYLRGKCGCNDRGGYRCGYGYIPERVNERRELKISPLPRNFRGEDKPRKKEKKRASATTEEKAFHRLFNFSAALENDSAYYRSDY